MHKRLRILALLLFCVLTLPALCETAYAQDSAFTAQVNADVTDLEISISEQKVSASADSVRFAVWSETNGQDDLHWYSASEQSDGTWTAAVPLQAHSGTGTYLVHCYQTVNGTSSMCGATSASVPKVTGSASAQSTGSKDGSFRVSLSRLTNADAIAQVKVAVWSTANGQDDLKWTNATQSGDSWTVDISTADHAYDEGDYLIHVYVVDRMGNTYYISAAKQSVQVDRSAKSLSVAWNASGGTLSGSLCGAYTGRTVTGVKFAVWSETNGQDDLHWYDGVQDAQGNWSFTAPLSNHKSDGTYYIHSYQITASGKQFLSGTSTQVTKLTGKLTAVTTDTSSGSFRLTLSDINVPAAVSKVRVAVWSSSNGQDDLQWYTAAQKGSTWQVDVNTYQHHYDSGAYLAHVYVTDTQGRTTYLAATTQTVTVDQSKRSLTATEDSSSAQIHISLNNAYLDPASTVKFAVWSEECGQDDLVWYTAAANTDGSWTADLDLGEHHYDSGKYYIHAYLVSSSGKKMLNGTSLNVTILKATASYQVSDNTDNAFTITAYDLRYSDHEWKELSVAVWSEEDGQDDLVWYTAQQADDGSWSIHGTMEEHGYVSGTYYVHVYTKSSNGTSRCISVGQVDLTGCFRLSWPTTDHSITSYFGKRVKPTAGASSNHMGIDIHGSKGDPIYAAASGTVTEAGYNSSRGYYVVIDHGNGISTVYMHCNSLRVHAGQTVTRGSLIATIGRTGVATGPHLHFGVQVNGIYVNPLDYLS